MFAVKTDRVKNKNREYLSSSFWGKNAKIWRRENIPFYGNYANNFCDAGKVPILIYFETWISNYLYGQP